MLNEIVVNWYLLLFILYCFCSYPYSIALLVPLPAVAHSLSPNLKLPAHTYNNKHFQFHKPCRLCVRLCVCAVCEIELSALNLT